MDIWRRFLRQGVRQKLLLVCALVCLPTLTGVFLYLDHRQESFYMKSMVSQARGLFKQIVITRKWVADHGGIFVEELPWIRPNPYLEQEAVLDTANKRYIKENPAMVTRELSEYAKEQGSFWFHITSLKLVNPSNAPDSFERKALENFKRNGLPEVWGVEHIGKEKYFRYIAPLYIEKACLKCHARHGYKVGDVRGAISVAIPLEAFYASLHKERIIASAFTLLVGLVLMVGLYVALNVSVVSPVRALSDFAMAWRGRSGAGRSGGHEPSEVPSACSEADQTSGDEIHGLFMELCKLHRAVTSHEQELQDKVSAATEELSRTNQDLATARDRYRELSMKKSQFIAGLSHELRTPITSVKGAASYITNKLESGKPVDDETRQELLAFLEIINRNINRFVKLVADTLDLGKIEASQIELHPTEMDVAGLLAEAKEEFTVLALKENIVIKVDAPQGLTAYADGDRVRQALDNLLLNALHHSPKGSEIVLGASVEGGMVVFWVADEGPGIAPEMREKIFEQFQKGTKEGSGLGLAISKGIVEAHGGRIWVECPGSGSVFRFTLPSAERGEKGISI